MNKTALKVFLSCSAVAAVTALVLLVLNLCEVMYIANDSGKTAALAYRSILDGISAAYDGGGAEEADTVALPEGCWCILVDGAGDVIWSHDRPADVPTHYTLSDIAVLSRWFLSDYPVYTRTHGAGLFILGQPKNAVGKYFITLSTDWFSSLGGRIALVLALDAALALALALVIGSNLYKNLKRVTAGIEALSREESVHVAERGMFRDTCRQLNRSAEALARKNAALAERDRARRNWVNGISHDVRTPLAVIMGNAEAIGRGADTPPDTRERADKIVAQSAKIGRLIDDLDLMSSLENDMQSRRRERVRLCPILREVMTDVINSGLPDGFTVDAELRDEGSEILCDRALIERAVFNLISNAVRHNTPPCAVHLTEYSEGGHVRVVVRDNGQGAPQEVLDSIAFIPDAAHGLGLPMAYRIAAAHGGQLEAHNDHGLVVTMTLPLAE